jgi:hypothetical protein
MPLRDAFIGYFSGLTLLFAPFLLGEMAIRAVVHRARTGVRPGAICVINLWERYLDATALAVIAAATSVGFSRWTF